MQNGVLLIISILSVSKSVQSEKHSSNSSVFKKGGLDKHISQRALTKVKVKHLKIQIKRVTAAVTLCDCQVFCANFTATSPQCIR